MPEQAMVPLKCSACDGAGGKEIEWCPVPGCPGPNNRGEGCSHAQVGFDKCPECDGTGLVRCSVCDSMAVMIATDGSPACQTCGLEAAGQLNLLGEAAA